MTALRGGGWNGKVWNGVAGYWWRMQGPSLKMGKCETE